MPFVIALMMLHFPSLTSCLAMFLKK